MVIVLDEQMIMNVNIASKGIQSYEMDKLVKHGTWCPFAFFTSSL